MVIVIFSEIIALKCSDVRRRTEAELGLFLLLFARTQLVMVALFASWGGGGVEHGVGCGCFKCLEWGKVRYLVMSLRRHLIR